MPSQSDLISAALAVPVRRFWMACAAPAGYVRGVFFARRGGHCVPVDLVRVVLRSAGRLAMRRRLAADFAGYLVTDSDAGYSFVSRRVEHERDFLPECVSGGGGFGYRADGYRDDAGGPLDAPDNLPAGSMRGAEYGGFSAVVSRVSWSVLWGVGFMPFVRWRWWHQITGAWCLTAGWGATDGELRGEFADAGGCLDAPEFLPCGGCVGGSVLKSGTVVSVGLVVRRGRI